jgi:hypothetical protein
LFAPDLFRISKTIPSITKKAPKAAPMPIPALAPVERLPSLVLAVGDVIGVVCVDIDVGIIAVVGIGLVMTALDGEDAGLVALVFSDVDTMSAAAL